MKTYTEEFDLDLVPYLEAMDRAVLAMYLDAGLPMKLMRCAFDRN